MSDLAEDRVFTNENEATDVFVATEIGIIVVSVSGDRFGRFGVAHRCSPSDITGRNDILAVATETDVLWGRDREFEGTEFGPATAVGIHEDAIISADANGRIERYVGDRWTEIGTVDAPVTVIDGSLVVTEAGLYRIEADARSLQPIDNRSVTDVADSAALAATDTGLYTIAEEWNQELEGDFSAVAASGADHALAVDSGELWQRWDANWTTIKHGDETSIADVAVGERGYAITETGRLLVGPSFRGRSLGLTDVIGLAVP